MLVANAIAEVLKREKVKFIIGYPPGTGWPAYGRCGKSSKFR